jgi:hypothetical protein
MLPNRGVLAALLRGDSLLHWRCFQPQLSVGEAAHGGGDQPHLLFDVCCFRCYCWRGHQPCVCCYLGTAAALTALSKPPQASPKRSLPGHYAHHLTNEGRTLHISSRYASELNSKQQGSIPSTVFCNLVNRQLLTLPSSKCSSSLDRAVPSEMVYKCSLSASKPSCACLRAGRARRKLI